MDGVEVKHCSHQDNQGKYNYKCTYNLVQDADSVDFKLLTNLVNKPRKPEPPHERASDNANIANGHLQRMVGNDKGKLGERGHKKEDNQRVGECQKESSETVVRVTALVLPALMYVACRVTLPAIDAEEHQNNAS